MEFAKRAKKNFCVAMKRILSKLLNARSIAMQMNKSVLSARIEIASK